MRIVEVLKALADETRLRLLNVLKNRDMCVCELETILDLSQPNVSRHLKALKAAGLVGTHRAGQWIHYWIHPDFSQEQKDLWQALASLMHASGGIYQGDQSRYERYEERGWTCQDIKSDRARISRELNEFNETHKIQEMRDRRGAR